MTPNWYQSLLLAMAKGQYLNLSPRPRTENDWLILWGLIQEGQANPIEVKSG